MNNASKGLFCILLTLVGCVQSVSNSTTSLRAPEAPTTSIFLSPTCKATTEAFPTILIPLAIEFGKQVIDTGVAFIQKRIEKVVDEHKASYSVVFSGDFFKVAQISGDTVSLEPNYHCITVVRGYFGAAQDDSINAGDWSKARLEMFGLRAKPSLVFEGIIQLSGNKQHFKISPTYLEVNDVMAKRGRDRKSITVKLTLVKPASSVETALQDPLGTSAVQFIDIEIPGKRDKNQISRSDTLWFSVPPSQVSKTEVSYLRKNTTVAPFSLIVTVLEESEPSDAWNISLSVAKTALPKAKDMVVELLEGLKEDNGQKNSSK